MVTRIHLLLAAASLAAPPADPAQADRERKVRVALSLAESGTVPVKEKHASFSDKPVELAKNERLQVIDWFGDAAKVCPCCGPGEVCKCGKGHSCGSPTCPAGCVREAAPAPRAYKDPAWFTADSYADAVKERDRTGKAVVMLFTDPVACLPCRQLESGALADEAVKAAMGKTINVRVNVKTDAGAALAREAKIAQWPTVVVYRDGLSVGKTVGAVSAAELLKVIQK